LSLADDHPSHDILTPALSKRRCNEAHAQRRLAERHGLDPTLVATITALVAASAPQAVPLRHDRDHPNRQWYAVWVESEQQWIPIVWDRSTGSVVTCLPWDKITRYHAHLTSVEARWRDWSEEEKVTAAPDSACPDPAAEERLIPAGTTVADVLPQIEERKARIEELHSALRLASGTPRRTRRTPVLELERVTAELRVLKIAIARTRTYWGRVVVQDQPIAESHRGDPYHLLVFAHRMLTRLRQQIGWEAAGPEASELVHVIVQFLLHHAPIVPAEEPPPCT
jgi:hypothetical protein